MISETFSFGFVFTAGLGESSSWNWLWCMSTVVIESMVNYVVRRKTSGAVSDRTSVFHFCLKHIFLPQTRLWSVLTRWRCRRNWNENFRPSSRQNPLPNTNSINRVYENVQLSKAMTRSPQTTPLSINMKWCTEYNWMENTIFNKTAFNLKWISIEWERCLNNEPNIIAGNLFSIDANIPVMMTSQKMTWKTALKFLRRIN